jgi:hypothetical protein
LEAVIATSFHQPPVPAEFQAERRCISTRLRAKQVRVFPCRGSVAPCQRTARSIKEPLFRCQTRFPRRNFVARLGHRSKPVVPVNLIEKDGDRRRIEGVGERGRNRTFNPADSQSITRKSDWFQWFPKLFREHKYADLGKVVA